MQIKFRAWCNNSEKMITEPGYFQISGDGTFEVFNDVAVEWESNGSNGSDLVLMQFRGLKDKNGIESYEHDIVQTYYDDGSKGDIGYLECTNLGSLCVTVKGRDFPMPLHFYNSWEVIGNIHQNPELIEQPAN